MPDKHTLFSHLTGTLEFISALAGFAPPPSSHHGSLTHMKAPNMNVMSLGKKDPAFITELKSQNTPFFCFSSAETEERFDDWAKDQGLVYGDQVVGITFTGLQAWKCPDLPKGVTTRIAKTEDDLRVFDTLAANAHKTPEGVHARFFRPALNFEPTADHPALAILLMYADGIPVGTGLISIKDGIGGLYWGGVHSDHRNKRLGTALAHARMEELQKMGVDTIWVQAMSPSINLFKRIGFKEGEAVTFYKG